MFVLARQFVGLFGERMALGSTGTSEGPLPSAITGHGAMSEYATLKTVRPAASASVTVSPPFERFELAPHT